MNIEEILSNPSKGRIIEIDRLIKNGEIELNYIEDFIFKSNDAYLIYLCGIYIEWINKGRVAHALSKTLDDYYILEYAHYIQNLKDITEGQKKTILKELGKGMSMCKGTFRTYYYARDILYAPIDNLALALSKSNNAAYIFYMLRDLGEKLTSEAKEKLERRIISLKNSDYIAFVAKIASVVKTNEFAEGLLNAKKTKIYAVYLCMFLKENKIEDKELKNRIIENIMKSGDYRRIIDLIKSTDDVPYIEIIDHILSENDNAENPDFWLNYIIPLTLCNRPCSSYAVEKIIESNNIEVMSIAVYYIKDDYLRILLQSALNKNNNLSELLNNSTLGEKVISRVKVNTKVKR